MRLLHIVPTYVPAFRYGGPIYSVHGLCRSLAAAGHEVHVLTTSVDGPHDSNVPHDRAVDIDGVSVHYCRSRWLRRLYWSPDLFNRCGAMAGEVDAVHLHSVFLFPTWAGAHSAKRAGVPYILSPRGMLVRELISRRSSMLKRAWIGLIERRNLAGAAVIHVTSDEERRALVELDCALAATVVIPNGVDPPGPTSSVLSTDIRAALDEGFDILSFGRISWKKGLDRLIGALVELPDARAVIAGNDEEGESRRLRALAERLGVGDRVRFIARRIDGADKEALYAGARLFALPSLSENFGNVVVEALARSLPVVVTQGVGAAELVVTSGGGAVAANDAASFAALLKQCLASEEWLKQAGAAGAAHVLQHLSWKKIATRFTELYSEIIAVPRTVGIERVTRAGAGK